MQVQHAHGLTPVDAIARLEALTTYWAERFGVDPRWEGERCVVYGEALGVSASGTILVRADRIILDGPDPPWLFRGKVKAYLDRKLGYYLDPQVPLDELMALRPKPA